MIPDKVIFWIFQALITTAIIAVVALTIAFVAAGIIKAIDNFIDKATRCDEKVQDLLLRESHQEKRGDHTDRVCKDAEGGRNLQDAGVTRYGSERVFITRQITLL